MRKCTLDLRRYLFAGFATKKIYSGTNVIFCVDKFLIIHYNYICMMIKDGTSELSFPKEYQRMIMALWQERKKKDCLKTACCIFNILMLIFLCKVLPRTKKNVATSGSVFYSIISFNIIYKFEKCLCINYDGNNNERFYNADREKFVCIYFLLVATGI